MERMSSPPIGHVVARTAALVFGVPCLVVGLLFVGAFPFPNLVFSVNAEWATLFPVMGLFQVISAFAALLAHGSRSSEPGDRMRLAAALWINGVGVVAWTAGGVCLLTQAFFVGLGP